MPQTLSDKLYEEYKLKASASLRGDSDLAGRTQPTSLEPQPQRDIWDVARTGEYPEWYRPTEGESPASSMLNAIGVGLWSFVDTASFGGAGALVEEEKFLDLEDPLAKWTGAIGGFAGFVKGFPLRVGARIAQKALPILAGKQLRNLGKKSAETVISGMKESARGGGLSKKSIKEITKGYKSLVRQAQVDPRLQGAKFEQATRTYLARYGEKAVADGVMTEAQAVGLQRMFDANIFKRPIQDFMGLMAARGLAQTSPRLSRVIGHSINDAIMFGAIDTVFEGVSMVEDRHFDITAPLWGAGTGVAFGQLGWLKPRGKAASFKADFMGGVKAAFGEKGTYNKLSRDQLVVSARFMGENLKKHQKGSEKVVFSFRGSGDKTLNLASDNLFPEMRGIWGKDADKALINLLEGQKNKFGSEMMRWAVNQEAKNMMLNWRRMMLGGILFNTHTIYDMYAHDVEPDVSDVLPSFLIGAFVQRRSNPAKFDLNPRQMNQLRGNLSILGIAPQQFAAIPTFDFKQSRFESIFNNPKFDPVIDLVRNLEIGTDSNEVRAVDLEPDVVSAAKEPSLLFEDILPQLKNHFAFVKELDQISAADAKKVTDAIVKIDGKFGDDSLRRRAKEDSLLETQQGFEESFKDLVAEVNDPENVLNIKPEKQTDGTTILSVPNSISIDEALKKRAKDGELPWLGVDADNVPLKGDEALDRLYNKIDGFSTALLAADQLGDARKDSNPSTNHKTIKSEALLRDIFEKVVRFEENVESKFPDNTIYADRFTIADSYPDYADILVRNHAIRIGNTVTSMFRQDYSDRDKLVGLMQKAGVMYSPETIGKSFIVDDVSKVNISGEGVSADQISKDKRFISRVLTLQSAVGGYEVFKIDKNTPLEVQHSDIKPLREYLESKAVKLDVMPQYLQSRIIGHAVNERIQKTNLNMDQVDALWTLQEYGAVNFGEAAEGKVAGFTVKLINEDRIKGHDESKVPKWAAEYNESMKRIIDDSNGLVVPEADRMVVADKTYMRALVDALPKDIGDPSMSARGMLADFMTQLGASRLGFSSFRKTLTSFINEKNTNANRAVNWLAKVGVFTPITNSRGYDIEVEKFNELIREDMANMMTTHGFDAKYSERLYVESEQRGKDNRLEDSTERKSEKPIDLNTFYKRYRIDGKDLTQASPEEAKLVFDTAVYYSKRDKILNRDIINGLLDVIHIDRKNDGDYEPFIDLPASEQTLKKPQIIRDMIGLLGSQRAQIQLDVLKFSGGTYVKERQTVQLSRLHHYMDSILELPYLLVDSKVPVSVLSRDGRFIIEKEVDIFNDTRALSPDINDHIINTRTEFEKVIKQERSIFENEDFLDLVGENDERGLRILQIAPNMDAIAIATKDLASIKEPFRELINEYKDREGLDSDGKRVLRDIERKIDENQVITTDEYEHMLTHLLMKEMLTGSDGDRTFMDFLNGKDSEKLLSRIKLFNTKKYVRFNKDFILDVDEVYSYDETISNALRRIARNDGFGVALFNDEDFARIRPEVERAIEEAGVEWSWDNVIGKAHEKKSRFDSIGFVSRDQLRFMHAMAGNDPYSYNPIKPVITSGGAGSPLLLGKTLFIYSKELRPFFESNRDVDILLTKTGAKVHNPVGDALDTSLVNVRWSELNSQVLSADQVRKISIDSLGIMPNKDATFAEAKKSQADANYMDNVESSSMFNSEFRDQLETNITSMKDIMRDPISLKQWIIEQLGDDALVPDAQAGESLRTLNNLVVFATHSRDANPMSYSDRIVKNKMYNIFIDSVINKQRSTTNQYDGQNSHRYGGNSVLIPGAIYGLKPTLVNKSGEKIMTGEVMLPWHVAEMGIRDLSESGYEMRFVRGDELLDGEKVFGKLHWDELIKTDAKLDTIKESLDYMVSQGEILEGTKVGIMVRRNPRTRPNDFALMELRGFLSKTYGNSVAVNSLDVANVMEGDYDFDKADYFFAHRPNMFNHVKRASEFFVQGVDPTDFKDPVDFKLGMDASQAKKKKHEMIATGNVFHDSIGMVQKIPRMLGFADKLGAEGIGNSAIEQFNRLHTNTKFRKPKILLGGNPDQDFMVVMDYDNLEFYLRSALETQYIIDGDTKLNPDISEDIRTWRDDFIFPTREKSFSPSEVKQRGMGFVNNMRETGNHEGKRVRIFRKIVKVGKNWDEINLTDLDRAVVKQLLFEYGKLLGITRDSVYENTGRQKKTEHQDAYSGAERFFMFNQNINDNLYYRLRRLHGSNVGKKDSPWYNDEDFKSYFGVKEIPYEDRAGKERSYFKPTAKLLHSDVIGNATEFAEGTRGAPIDRIMHGFYKGDPFHMKQTRLIGTRMAELIDEWYNELHGGGEAMTSREADDIIERFESKADKLTRGVKKGMSSYNYKVQLVGSVKKKIALILNSNMRFDAKKTSIDKLNAFVKRIEGEIGYKLLPPEYIKSRSKKDLPKIEIVMADEKNMIDGTIHYSTMDQVRNLMPFDWSLNSIAQRDLNFLYKIRKLFYGNRSRKKDFLKYGGRTLLEDRELRLLNKFPDISTFYQIETKLLQQGFEAHGAPFIYQFMQPTQNKRAVGIFNNRPVSVPYQAKEAWSPSSRYRRGMRFITGLSSGTIRSEDPLTRKLAKESLSHLQFIEAQFERFFNKRIDMKTLIGEEVGDFLDVGALGKAGRQLIYNNIRLPDFDKDFEKLFSDFRSVQWRRDSNRISGGFNLMNDHLLDFYANVMKLAGKEKEFESYLNKMHAINADMMGYDIIDPVKYLSQRAEMDKEVRLIAQEVIVDGILARELKNKSKVAEAITNNPVYALMGGKNYFKGISLEKSRTYNLDRLKDMKEMADAMEEMKDNIAPGSYDARKSFEQIGLCFKR